MILRSPTDNENTDFVMPAWIAGIHQVRKDAPGDIRVDLDSSTPCWNDATAGALLEPTEVRPPIFSKEATKNPARRSRNQKDFRTWRSWRLGARNIRIREFLDAKNLRVSRKF
jgi:hypothetical protein